MVALLHGPVLAENAGLATQALVETPLVAAQIVCAAAGLGLALALAARTAMPGTPSTAPRRSVAGWPHPAHPLRCAPRPGFPAAAAAGRLTVLRFPFHCRTWRHTPVRELRRNPRRPSLPAHAARRDGPSFRGVAMPRFGVWCDAYASVPIRRPPDMCLWAAPALAATVSGVVTDSTGAPVAARAWCCAPWPPAKKSETRTDTAGRYQLTTPAAGRICWSSRADGFAEAARTVVAERAGPDRRSGRAARAGRPDGRRQRDGRAQRARDPADSAARGNADGRGHRADANPVSTGEALATCGQHHAGRQRPLRRAAAPARAGLHPHAGADRRRAPEHRPPGHQPHRRRSGSHAARRGAAHRDRQRRGHAAVRIGRAGRHHQHRHRPSPRSRPPRSGSTASTATTARTRTAAAAR